jgi:hypothetical protein
MMSMAQAEQQMSPEQIAQRRRRARSTALKLALFALFVYFAFIVAFINR